MQYCVEDGVDRIMIMLMMTLDGLVVERGGGCRDSLITVLSRFSPWPSTLHCDQDDQVLDHDEDVVEHDRDHGFHEHDDDHEEDPGRRQPPRSITAH